MKSKWKTLLLVFAFVCLLGLIDAKEAKAASPYLIKINKQQCVVTIYKKDKAGKYTKPVKAMLCSPGSATPLGTFPLKEKIRWHTLDGPCYGQYCSRIVGGVLFHSVWYYQPQPNTLSCTQYNNLGSRVSHGCVRLCVRDAKWIYDNCPSGTSVVIYNSKNPGPLGKPAAIKIPGYQGWDPTDTGNPSNPWNKKKPTITGAKNKTIGFAEKYNIKKGLKVKNTTGYNSIKLLKTKILFKGGGSGKYRNVKKVNTKRPGIYKITYKITDEIGRTAKVTVKHKVLTKVSVSKITLNETNKILYLGGTTNEAVTTLKVKSIIPKKASVKKLKIAVSDRSVATINSKGKVTAKKAGVCYITYQATDGSGTEAVCKITVVQRAAGLTLTAPNTKLAVGKTMTLRGTISPVDTTNKKLTYVSSNTNVATVNVNGVVMAKNPGTVMITARTSDGTGKSAAVQLTVIHQFAQATGTPPAQLEITEVTAIESLVERLPKKITVQDISGNKVEIPIVYTSSDYHPDVSGEYTITGTWTLPVGWEGTVVPYTIRVKVTLPEE